MNTYCNTDITKEECDQDSTCTWVENKSFHPFSAFDSNSKAQAMDPEFCASIDGKMIESGVLHRYGELCNNDMGVLPGNTSKILENSSPDNNFKEFGKCWTCVKSTESVEDAQTCLEERSVFSHESMLENIREVVRTVNTIVSINDQSAPSTGGSTTLGRVSLSSMAECMKEKSMMECMT